MQNLHRLRQRLQKADKIAVLGVGSHLRGDDAAGILVAQLLTEKECPKIASMIGETAPENYTGEIRKIKPSHLIITDSAKFDGEPGEIRMIEMSEIDGYSFSTHSLPLKVMINFLSKDMNIDTFIIGINPISTEFGMPVNEIIQRSAKNVCDAIIAAAE